MALEDPLHYGFHRIFTWNNSLFKNSQEKAMKEFEKRLSKPKKEEKKWTSLDI